MHRSVACIVRLLEQLCAFALQKLFDKFEFAIFDRVTKCRECSFACRKIKTKDDACAAEDSTWSVHGRDKAIDTLTDIHDDDASLNSILDDSCKRTIRATRDVTHSKCLQNETTNIRQVKNSVNHLRLNTGKDTQTGNVGSVKALCNMEFGDRGRAKDERPVDTDAETVDLGDGFTVGTGEGLEFCSRDLCAAVAAVKTVVEEETDFGDSESSRDDERT
ncbi:hypothetical protein HG531_004366 [Fusarium graminearum]|nr:hypothetical protein HG531_004366 [Fusarium graminearum]